MPFVPDLSDRLVQVGFPAALAEELQTVIQGPVSGAGNLRRTTPVRVATFGDSTANVSGYANTDISTYSTTFAAHVTFFLQSEKWQLPSFYRQAWLVANGGISGQSTAQMVARDTTAAGASRKSIQDVIDLKPDVVLLRGGSINDLTGVTSATVAATVASSLANHMTIVNRFVSAGIAVIDEGVYGYSGAGATDPAATRSALLQLNAQIKASVASLPNVLFLDWTGILSGTDGAYLDGSIPLADGLGIHLSMYGQYLAAKQEAAAMQQLFGPCSGMRYPGKNAAINAATAATGGNPLLANSGVQAYGTVATGFAVGVANGTRQNAKIEVINGKLFQTCEVAPTAAGCYLTMYAPLDAANWAPAVGDVWAVELDWFVSGLNGAAPPTFTGFSAAWDFTSTNNIVLQPGINTQVVQLPIQGGIAGTFVSQPFSMPADTAALSLAELFIKFQSDAQVPWKQGIGANARLVKL